MLRDRDRLALQRENGLQFQEHAARRAPPRFSQGATGAVRRIVAIFLLFVAICGIGERELVRRVAVFVVAGVGRRDFIFIERLL